MSAHGTGTGRAIFEAVAMLVVGGGVAFGAAFVYSYAIRYIPFVYLTVIGTAVYGFLVGGAAGGVSRMMAGVGTAGAMSFLVALILSVVAIYFGWVTYVFVITDEQILTFDIGNIFRIMGILADKGSWSIFGWTPKGAALYTIWVLEALIILFVTLGSLLAVQEDELEEVFSE